MNIQQLRAQIAALQDATMDENKNFHSSYDEGKFDALSAVDALLDSLQEDPISKDLEEAAVEAFKWIVDSDKNSFLEIFKAGAKWKEEQYKKNLLDVCKKQTEEEAEIERDFIEGIIDEHRLPTFDDAIKYGMRLQKEQFEKEHTKNCGNVEYEQDVYPPAYQPWFTPDQAKKAVEIAREEIYKWLANHYRNYMHNPTGEKLEAFFGMDMITDLKQAIKDE